MTAPLRFATRNIVFGQTDRDVWAVYRLELESYEGLTVDQKVDLLGAIASFAYSIQADFNLRRVSRTWSVGEYADRVRSGAGSRYAHKAMLEDYLGDHQRRLGDRELLQHELYLDVRLAPPTLRLIDKLIQSAGQALAQPLETLRGLFVAAGAGDPRALSESRLRELANAEARVYARVGDFFAIERATTLDQQWLCRRAFCHGLGEPEIDVHYRPQALVFMDDEQLTYKPLEVDVMRLFDSPIEVEDRGLKVRSERGTSHQALLVLGALPKEVQFPSAQAELLFAPVEGVDFPVDAAFSCEWVPNKEATDMVRRKVIDADNVFGEESAGDHGPSADSAERPALARELEDYVTGEGLPPLMRATVTYRIGAPTGEERDRRVTEFSSQFGTVTLHRPLGEQVALFRQHFPGGTTQVRDYVDYLTVEQLGAMMPVGTHAVGSHTGPYIGYTLSGSSQPVLFDLTEASRINRTPSTLLCGALGSGKTMLLQTLLYQRFLLGSRIVDIDPKGDHQLDRLPGVSGEHVEKIVLGGDDGAYRGLLDPLRIAPPGTVEDFATSFLIDILPPPFPSEWRTEIRSAVKTVVAAALASGRSAHCGQVITELERGGPEAQRVARSLAVYSDSGLAQLGFGYEGQELPDVGRRQITSLQIRNLPRPIAGTPRDELTEAERIGQAVLRLLAAFAMYLMGGDPKLHKVLGFDEAWFLTEDAAGRRLIEHLNRWGRSENAAVILIVHLVKDVEALSNLIGVRVQLGMEDEDEAAAGLRLLRLDPDDQALRRKVLSARQGRCLIRDLHGRIASVQIDPGPTLVDALNTNPQAGGLTAA